MILLTNGCSWTWGGGLGPNLDDETRSKYVWPYYLGQLLGAEKVVNLSKGCGSNQRILRTTLNWISEQNQETLNNTLAIIQWTENSRYEYYNSKNVSNIFENDSDKWALAKIDCVIDKESRFNDQDYILHRNKLRLETYTKIEGLYKNIFECLALDNLFKRHNINYYFWSFVWLPDIPLNLKTIYESFNWLKHYKNWKYDRVSKDDVHPNILGNQQIAKYIFNEIKLN